MPNRQSYDTTEGWPAWLLRAISADRSYYARARCRTDTGVVRVAWTAERKKRYQPVPGGEVLAGDELIELACMQCRLCPVQWDCVRTAIQAGEPIGTWADRIENVQWLATQEDWQRLVDGAEETGVSVQELITIARRVRAVALESAS